MRRLSTELDTEETEVTEPDTDRGTEATERDAEGGTEGAEGAGG